MSAELLDISRAVRRTSLRCKDRTALEVEWTQRWIAEPKADPVKEVPLF